MVKKTYIYFFVLIVFDIFLIWAVIYPQLKFSGRAYNLCIALGGRNTTTYDPGIQYISPPSHTSKCYIFSLNFEPAIKMIK
jgi:hypothetical protein